MNWKNWASVLSTSFVGGLGGYATTHLGDGLPTTATQWKAFGIGAVVAGMASVAHLFQTPGGKSAPAQAPS